MELQGLVEAAMLAGVATLNVTLWTVRVALAARGRRAAASATSCVEALLFAVAFSRVMDALDDPLRISGYAVGVAAGTFAGLTIEAGSHRRAQQRPRAEPARPGRLRRGVR
jgi:uncharacterized protein YebE (UPF0316 family)